MRHVWAAPLALVAIVVSFLASCSSSSSVKPKPAAAPPSQQVLTVAYPNDDQSQDILTMDPAVVTDFVSIDMAEKVFPTLLVLQYDPRTRAGLTLAPWAATALPTLSADGLTMTVHLRSGLTWTDGTPIDANDFAYSINRALDPCTAQGQALGAGAGSFFLSWLQGAYTFAQGTCKQPNALDPTSGQGLLGRSILVVDPLTLQFKLETLATWARWSLVTAPAMAVPQSLITRYGLNGLNSWTHHLADGPAGFGGNVFNLAAWDHVGHMTFVANPTFWGRPKPTLQKLTFTFYADPSAAYRAYLAGQDLQEYGLPAQDYPSASQHPDFHQVPFLNINFAALNWGRAPFDSLLARQAFALALNKTQLTQAVSSGTAFATNHMIPQGESDYNPNLEGPDGTPSLTGSPTVAAQDWQQYAATHCPGGLAANCPAVTVVVASFRAPESVAKEELSQWEQVLGVRVNIEIVSPSQYVALLFGPTATRPQIFNAGYSVDFPIGWDWTSNQAEPGNGYGINDPAATRLMLQADTDQSPTQQAADYQAAEQQLVTDVAWISLFQVYAFWFNAPKVSGFTLNPADYWLPGNMLQTYIAA
jgi:peptide/nickel transport system substrate-binding protein/oligopeptide transport system substrate-binding protein